jgi:YD repeat-containing protein
MRTGQAVLGILLLAAGLAGCATTTVREARVLTGQVTDESGAPVAGSPVLLVARSLDLSAVRMQYDERGRREVQTVTDGQGRYRIEFVPTSLGNNFFLFFYDASGFDRVKYQRPEPLDITERLRRDRTTTINPVLRLHPGWPEVVRQIAFYGAESARGQILRRHGVPEKRETPAGPGDETEAWWFYADGVTYWFSGPTLIRTSTFPSIPGPVPPR